ncbi:hypothetical protein M0D73_10280 [Shewanella putrefaciens]|uniref:hypothetical protein n=1 Tax=unclassified Shewanella TaxID=196818 RepID=UPI002004B59D|nr:MULTISPECIES: hypothetical protein [unclassified Shewanella]MCK7630245.1 hypothetical protein [Shewanella sp. JNE9-1]MCK7653405.1 hypothetical protein [Shewanella sp. JNE4-1]
MNELMMREATPQDYDAYYNIKCEKNNILWSGYSNQPNYEKLKTRFDDFFIDDTQGLLLFEFNNEVIGYVNFFFTEKKEFVETSHGALSNEKIKSLGYKMLKMANHYFDSSDRFNSIKGVIGWVAESNFASLQNVIKNGYHPTGKSEVRQLAIGRVKFDQYKKKRAKNE